MFMVASVRLSEIITKACELNQRPEKKKKKGKKKHALYSLTPALNSAQSSLSPFQYCDMHISPAHALSIAQVALDSDWVESTAMLHDHGCGWPSHS